MVGAWDAYSRIGCLSLQDPFEKTGYQDVRRGKFFPRILVCLVLVINPSFAAAVILKSDSVVRHKPGKDQSARPTISPPSSLRAVLVRRRKFFHASTSPVEEWRGLPEQARSVHRLVTVNTALEAYDFRLTLLRKVCQQENRP